MTKAHGLLTVVILIEDIPLYLNSKSKTKFLKVTVKR